MKASLIILLGVGLLLGTKIASRASLQIWAPGTSENFRRGTRAFCLVWFTVFGLILIAAGLWLLFSPAR